METLAPLVPLKTFPKAITLNNTTFSLIGIVNYTGGINATSVGYYTAYTLYGSNWILFDDLLKKCTSVTENSTVNPVICLYIKAQ